MVDVKQRARDQTRSLYRQGILKAAEAVFVEKGFAGARMSDIAAAAGLATGTLYNYFKSKESIFAEMLREAGHDFFRRLDEALDSCATPIERVYAFISSGLDFTFERGGLYRVMHALGPPQTLPPEIAQDYAELEQGYNERLHSALSSAQSARQIRDDISPEMLAVVVGASLTGLMDAVIADPRQHIDRSAAAIAFTQVIMKGIAL